MCVCPIVAYSVLAVQWKVPRAFSAEHASRLRLCFNFQLRRLGTKMVQLLRIIHILSLWNWKGPKELEPK